MKLVPSERHLLMQSTFINLHLIYPTLYPHQRRGCCLVNVGVATASSDEATSQPEGGASATLTDMADDNTNTTSLMRNITFDTRVFLTHVPPILKHYYDLPEVKWKFDQSGFLNPTLETEVCDSPDEDPLDRCLPVDCAIKYSGSRSFFDPKSRLCVKVPSCESDASKELPNVAYEPTKNTCRDLENPLTPEDLEYFRIGVCESDASQDSSSELEKDVAMLRCHNGKENAGGGSCICHSGWETYSPLDDDREPPLPEVRFDEDVKYVPFHMCTIQNYGEGPPSLLDVKSVEKEPEVIPVMVVGTMIWIIMMFMVAVLLCWLFTRPFCFTCWKIKKTY